MTDSAAAAVVLDCNLSLCCSFVAAVVDTNYNFAGLELVAAVVEQQLRPLVVVAALVQDWKSSANDVVAIGSVDVDG